MKLPPTFLGFLVHVLVFVAATTILLVAVSTGYVSETTPVPLTISGAIDFFFSLSAFAVLPAILFMLLLLAYEVRKFKPAKRVTFFLVNFFRGALAGKFYFMGSGYAAFAFWSGKVAWIPQLENGIAIPLLTFAVGYLVWWAIGRIFQKVVRIRR